MYSFYDVIVRGRTNALVGREPRPAEAARNPGHQRDAPGTTGAICFQRRQRHSITNTRRLTSPSVFQMVSGELLAGEPNVFVAAHDSTVVEVRYIAIDKIHVHSNGS